MYLKKWMFLRVSQLNIGQISEVLQGMGRNDWRNQWGQEHHRIIWQGLTRLLEIKDPVAVWPRFLYLYYDWVAWCTRGIPNSGSRGYLWLFCLLAEPFPPTGLPCPALMVWAWSYCSWLCWVWLMSMEGRLSYCIWREAEVVLRERGGREEMGEREGRENCSWDVI